MLCAAAGQSLEIRLFICSIHLNPHPSHALERVVRVHSALSEAFSENRDGGKGKEEFEFVKGFMFRWDVVEVGCGVNVELVQ